MNRSLPVAGATLCALLLAGCQATLPARVATPDDSPAAALPPAAPATATPEPEALPPTTASPPPDGATATQVPAPLAPAADEAPTAAERSGAEVFASLRSRLDALPCPEVAARNPWFRRYLAQPDALNRQLARALPLLDFVSRRVSEEDLPAEFALVPLVESGYRADALGVGKPAGLWQLIPSTARNHGVRFAPGFDGRLSPLDSTQAALSYLKTLEPDFDSWQAMAMAYNAGENRVRRALKRFGPEVSALDRKPDTLSPVTYHYVAKLEAVACLIAEPPAVLRLPDEARFAPLYVARIPDDITDVDALAAATGMSREELHRFNPGYRRKLIAPGAPREILVPADARMRLAMRMPPAAMPLALAQVDAAPAEPASASAPVSHQVRAGDTLWTIARRYGLSLAALLRLNGLRADTVLQPGQTLRLSP